MERFQEISEQGLLELVENRDSCNTKNVIKAAVNILTAFCDAKGCALMNFEMADRPALNTGIVQVTKQLIHALSVNSQNSFPLVLRPTW